MTTSAVISVRVSTNTKERLAAVARNQGLSESSLLKRLVEAALLAAAAVNMPETDSSESVAASGKLSVRLRPDDLLLLRDRARARAMPTSTVVSLLLRGYLRSLPPLPTPEFELLRKSLLEVGAIGRNINQIARALNSGERTTGPGVSELQALIRALTGLRDNFRGLLDANLKSWEIGYEKTNH
jgi:hypothetical protein